MYIYDQYILDLQATYVFSLQVPSAVPKKAWSTPAVAGHAWSIDSSHASQPTLRLDNFLLSRT